MLPKSWHFHLFVLTLTPHPIKCNHLYLKGPRLVIFISFRNIFGQHVLSKVEAKGSLLGPKFVKAFGIELT